MTLKRNIPNLITTFRLAGTVCLLFLEPFSVAFYVVYTLSGISDVLDGWVARKTKTTSEFGAKLDSIADLLFYAVMVAEIFPILWNKLPMSLWYIVAVVLILRLTSYGIAAWKYRRFASMHTYLNKLTGAAVFAMPYLIHLAFFRTYCWIACSISVVATIEELLIHCLSADYDPSVKTLLGRKKNLVEK